MKIAVICDLHLPDIKSAMQYEILSWAIDAIKKEKADLTVVAGDTTAFGEINALKFFLDKIKGLTSVFMLGNSDIRCEHNRDEIISDYSQSKHGIGDGYEILCINSPYTHLDDSNKEMLSSANDGAIIITHHNYEAFDEESRQFLESIFNKRKLMFVHGHKHKTMNTKMGKSTRIGVRGLDPDKIFGLPSVKFIELTGGEFNSYEKYYKLKLPNIGEFKNYIGMSCYRLKDDISFASQNKIKNIEIRLRSLPDDITELKKQISIWRDSGGKYLSVHMPDLKAADGAIQGADEFYKTALIAKELHADGLTIHVPKVSVCEMLAKSLLWRSFSDIMFESIKILDKKVRVGIENLHLNPGEKNDSKRPFGCVPEECITWIQELNYRFGKKRVEAVFDIGHASNNGILSSIYTRSVWYEYIGKMCCAYHIHQVIKDEGCLKNHKAIQNWFGMNISYVSFFMAWQKKHLNHAPMFLEMSTTDNVQKSLEALDLFISFIKKQA